MKEKFQHALLELMIEQMYFTVPINIAVCTLVALVIAPTFGVLPVALWVAFGAFIGVGRVLLFKRIMPNKLQTHQYESIIRIIAVALLLGGLQWGAAGWFFLDPQYPNLYLFVAVAILGMVSASLSNLSAMPSLWLLYAITVFTFVVARMLSDGNWSVALMSCLFVFGLWGLSRRLGQQILTSITKDFENAELLEDVKVAKEHAELRSLEKSRFLAATSHDLRQPLHAQGLYLAALKEQVNSDAQMELLNKIYLSNEALNSLFDSLLEISQLDANSIEVNRSHQSLKKLCEDMITEFQPLAADKSLSLELTGDDSIVFSDPVLLKRIIRNLLSNAIKFTNEGGVQLKIENNQNNLILSIKDTGIGIHESEHKAVFNEYVQLNNTSRDRDKGVGLGLALVQRMCKLLDLKLKLDSSPGNGACFKITLPLGDKDKMLPFETSPNSSSVDGLTIFVIDNDRQILDSMRTLESDWKCSFKLFSTLEQAELFIATNTTIPDVLVSDYRLAEELNGVDVISKIRLLYQKDIPALLISGDMGTKLLTDLQRSEINILHKPVSADKLKNTIARLKIN